LAEKRVFLYVPNYNFQAKGSFWLITALYFASIIKPRNFAKRQCKLQWLTPPTPYSYLYQVAHFFLTAFFAYASS